MQKKYLVFPDDMEVIMSSYQLSSWFNVKKTLLEEHRIQEPLIWTYRDTTVDIHDRDVLTKFQRHLMDEYDLEGVKIINEIFVELDNFEKRTILTSYPVNLQIEHTNICNAKCIMCSHCFTKNHGAKNMSDTDLKGLEEILPYVKHVTLHGMGEPFLYFNIIEILKMYHSYGIKVTCNTNASIMNEELAELIHKCFYDIAVSCDACTKETYEHIRKGLSFNKFIDNVKLLRSKGKKLHMRLSAVAMRQNLQELPGIVFLAAELGFQEVLFVDVTTQRLLENEKDCLLLYPVAAKYYLKKAEEEGSRWGISVKIPDYIMSVPNTSSLEDDIIKIQSTPFYKEDGFTENLYKRYEQAKFIDPLVHATEENFVVPSEYTCNGICDFVLERPFINVNGDVFMCCTNWMHTIGNIYKDGGFKAVWNGEIMRSIRKMFYDGYVPKYCVGCIFLRNNMMCKRIRLTNFTEAFYQHNYDDEVSKLLEGY